MITETLRSYSLTLDYLRRLLADVPDDLLTHQAGEVVNHPAWVIGHLVHNAQALGGELGLAPWLPEDWASRFGTGSVPVEDRSAYPDREFLLHALADAQRRLAEALTALGEDGLDQPLPDVRYRDFFPTIGHAVLHLLSAHAGIHVGQITVWRRTMKLGPLPDGTGV